MKTATIENKDQPNYTPAAEKFLYFSLVYSLRMVN